MNKKIIWKIALSYLLLLCLTTSCKHDDEEFNPAIIDAQVEELAQNVAAVINNISETFTQCDNSADFYQAALALKQMEGVEDVYESNDAVYVKFKGAGEISYLFPPAEEIEVDINSLTRRLPSKTRSSETSLNPQHIHGNFQSICVINQLHKDQRFKHCKDITSILEEHFGSYPIQFKVLDERSNTREFYENGLYNYDMIFLLTHGGYDEKSKLHWLLTGRELAYSEEAAYNEDLRRDLYKKLKENLKAQVQLGNKIGVGAVTETRDINGKKTKVAVYYEKISNQFLSNVTTRFNNNNAIVFNIACHSLRENNDIANSFINKGAACYIGYDDANSIGPMAGFEFFMSMLEGKTISDAIFFVPEQYKSQINSKGRRASLHAVYDSPEDDPITGITSSSKEDICMVSPEVLRILDESDENDFFFTLEGMMYVKDDSKNRYGFVISKKKDMSDYKILSKYTSYSTECEYDSFNQYSISIKQKLDKDDIELGETYYVAAYMYDGITYCVGEPVQFTAGSKGELGIFDLHGPVYSCTTGTVTRTFDRNGMWITHDGLGLWEIYRTIQRDSKGRIIKGIFDEDGNGETYKYNGAGRITEYNYCYFDDIVIDKYFYDEEGRMGYFIDDAGGLYDEEPVHTRCQIEDVDEYGNWTRRIEISTPGGEENVVTRTIQYYLEN